MREEGYGPGEWTHEGPRRGGGGPGGAGVQPARDTGGPQPPLRPGPSLESIHPPSPDCLGGWGLSIFAAASPRPPFWPLEAGTIPPPPTDIVRKGCSPNPVVPKLSAMVEEPWPLTYRIWGFHAFMLTTDMFMELTGHWFGNLSSWFRRAKECTMLYFWIAFIIINVINYYIILHLKKYKPAAPRI